MSSAGHLDDARPRRACQPYVLTRGDPPSPPVQVEVPRVLLERLNPELAIPHLRLDALDGGASIAMVVKIALSAAVVAARIS